MSGSGLRHSCVSPGIHSRGRYKRFRRKLGYPGAAPIVKLPAERARNMMLAAALFLFATCAAVGAPPVKTIIEYPRDVVKTLYIRNGGPRGYWQLPEFCPIGTYATGFRIKLERAMYAGGDDTSLNGVRLNCHKPGSLDFYGTISSENGAWGTWSKQYDCKWTSGQESFLVKFALKVEPKRGNFRDDSGANNIKFVCRPLHGTREYAVTPVGGPWGYFGGWSASCGDGSAVCGIQTKVAGPRGPGDDTALNDVRFFCCNDQLRHRCTSRQTAGESDLGYPSEPEAQ